MGETAPALPCSGKERLAEDELGIGMRDVIQRRAGFVLVWSIAVRLIALCFTTDPLIGSSLIDSKVSK